MLVQRQGFRHLITRLGTWQWQVLINIREDEPDTIVRNTIKCMARPLLESDES